MLRHLTPFLIFTCCCASLPAQNRVQLTIGDAVGPGGSELLCVPVIADSFPRIVSTQFSLGWDTERLTFTELRLGDNPLALTADNTSMPTDSTFGVSAIAPGRQGITLSAGTVLLTLCFTAVEASGATRVYFNDFLPPEFVQQGTFVPFPFRVFNGTVSFGSAAALAVLPGDTNDDFQVDHVDLLNIGLGFGATGPGREDSSANFSTQLATRWAQQFANGLNYAYADADGNGEIEAADLAVVRANYGRSAGIWTPGSDHTGRSAAAAARIVLEGGPFDAGARSSLRVVLGNDGTPAAAGYGLAFTVRYDETLIDPASIAVDFGNSFLGDDLLTIGRVSPNDPGRLEISLSRKDGTDTPNAPGEVCTITFVARNNATLTDYTTDFRAVPDGYLLADESSAAISGSTATVNVVGTTGVNEPEWASTLTIFPNPYVSGPLSIRGEFPRLDAVRVLTSDGRTVRNFSGNLRRVHLGKLAAGSYTLQLLSNGARVSRPLIVR